MQIHWIKRPYEPITSLTQLLLTPYYLCFLQFPSTVIQKITVDLKNLFFAKKKKKIVSVFWNTIIPKVLKNKITKKLFYHRSTNLLQQIRRSRLYSQKANKTGTSLHTYWDTQKESNLFFFQSFQIIYRL